MGHCTVPGRFLSSDPPGVVDGADGWRLPSFRLDLPPPPSVFVVDQVHHVVARRSVGFQVRFAYHIVTLVVPLGPAVVSIARLALVVLVLFVRRVVF